MNILCIFCETESDGSLKMIEGKVCEVKLYDYYESDNWLVDCPKKYGAGGSAHCSLMGGVLMLLSMLRCFLPSLPTFSQIL